MRSTRKVAKGAGLIFLGRLGAVIEVLTVFVFTRLYGVQNFGIFLLFWGYITILTVMCDFGMTMALQRFVPGEKDEAQVHRILKYALMIPIGLGVILAVVISTLAPEIAPFFNTSVPEYKLVIIMRIYVWAVPIWCLVETATAAIRARHVFGPEIRIRVFYEQILRLAGGVLFYYLGYALYGLFVSHLISLLIVALFALELLFRHYSLRQLLRPQTQGRNPLSEMLRFGALMVVPLISRKLQGNLPLLFLNAMIPGAAGAVAVTVYAVARKIVSALQVIRESFEYVMAPIVAADQRAEKEGELQHIFNFSTRLMSSLFIPAATLIYLFRLDLLSIAGDEFQGDMQATASAVIVILAIGRFLEVLVGPTNSVVAMIGRYRLPLANAVAGVLATLTLLYVLVPPYSLIGAAVAVTVGTNITSAAALIELYGLRRLQPYNRTMLSSLLMAALLSGILFTLVSAAAAFGLAAKLTTGIVVGGLVFYTLIRFIAAVDTGPDDTSMGKLAKIRS